MTNRDPSAQDMLEYVNSKYINHEDIVLQFNKSQRSVEERFHFTLFHLDEAQNYFEKLGLTQKEGIYQVQEMLRHRKDHNWITLLSYYKACVLAALQNIHSIADTLGSTVYFARGMDLNITTRINKDRRYLNSIIEKIADYQELKDELLKIKTGDFMKIIALNNSAKHESIFPMLLRKSFEPNEDLGYRAKYEYKDNDGNIKVEMIDLHQLISNEVKRCIAIRTTVRKLILSEPAHKT